MLEKGDKTNEVLNVFTPQRQWDWWSVFGYMYTMTAKHDKISGCRYVYAARVMGLAVLCICMLQSDGTSGL
jgi:hypothetical protein